MQSGDDATVVAEGQLELEGGRGQCGERAVHPLDVRHDRALSGNLASFEQTVARRLRTELGTHDGRLRLLGPVVEVGDAGEERGPPGAQVVARLPMGRGRASEEERRRGGERDNERG